MAIKITQPPATAPETAQEGPSAAPAPTPVKIKGGKVTPAPKPSAPVSGLTLLEIPVADLIEYGNNPRNNDSAVPRMVRQIKEFGFRVPILVRGNHIVDGHLRVKAARAMGLVTVPAIEVGNLTEAQERALRISINKTVEWAEWDAAKLDLEFKALLNAGMDLALTGFDMVDVAKVAQDALKLSLPPVTTPATPKTKTADAGTPADPAHVSVTFHMAAESRDVILERLKAHQKLHQLGNVSQALVHLLKSM